MHQRTLTLTPSKRSYLEDVLRHDPKPYLRERAGALLKIADGRSAHWVAKHGLLRPRKPDTVYEWMTRFERDGVLTPRPACRRAFSPKGPRT